MTGIHTGLVFVALGILVCAHAVALAGAWVVAAWPGLSFAAAILLHRCLASSASEAESLLRAVRPGVRLNAKQRSLVSL